MNPIYKILVVDDEAEIVEIMKLSFLETGKYQVFTAANGGEAYVRTRNMKFDIIFTDYNMPKSTGADLLFSLRDSELNVNTPVVFISAYLEPLKEKVKDRKNIYLMEKPFDSTELIEMAEKIISLQEKDAAQADGSANPGPKAQLDARLLNHFVNATTATIVKMTGMGKTTPQKPISYSRNSDLHIDISGALHMRSNKFNGMLAVAFPKRTFLSVMSRMLSKEFAEISGEIDEAAGEIIHMIYQQFRQSLQSEGYIFESATPTVIHGDNHRVSMSHTGTALGIPFDTDFGLFYVMIAIENPIETAKAA